MTYQLKSLHQITKDSLCLVKITCRQETEKNGTTGITINKQIYRYQTRFDKLAVSGMFIPET